MSDITMPITIFRQALLAAAKQGAKEAISELNGARPYMSKNEAFKRYGRPTVERWIEEGLVNPKQDGMNSSKFRIDRAEIEVVAETSNRRSYHLMRSAG